MADVETLGSGSQQHVLTGSIDRHRAARTRSTALGSSYRGDAASPVESSIESPATPVATHRGDALSHVFRPQSIPGHEVRAHRKIDSGRDADDVRKSPIPGADHLVARVGQPL